MKYYFLSMCLLLGTLVKAADPSIPDGLLKHFEQTYPAAKHVSWKVDGASYDVYFEMGKVKCRIAFDEAGEVTRSIRYYLGEELPPMLSDKIFRKWKGRKIFGVTEMSTPQEGIKYYITLEDDAYWYEVQADEGFLLRQTNRWKKA